MLLCQVRSIIEVELKASIFNHVKDHLLGILSHYITLLYHKPEAASDLYCCFKYSGMAIPRYSRSSK